MAGGQYIGMAVEGAKPSPDVGGKAPAMGATTLPDHPDDCARERTGLARLEAVDLQSAGVDTGQKATLDLPSADCKTIRNTIRKLERMEPRL